MPPLSFNLPSPSSQSFPPTPPSFANVELRQPALEPRTVRVEQDRPREQHVRVVKPELVIKIGSSKKRDKDKEAKYHRRSTGSVCTTSSASDVIYVESPIPKSPVVVLTGGVPPPPATPFFSFNDPVGYNTTYGYPTVPPPPPPPPPRRPTAPAASSSSSSSSQPSPPRRKRYHPVEVHQETPNPFARTTSTRTRRASTTSAPTKDDEFYARQAEREYQRAEQKRVEAERREIEQNEYQAQVERDRASARERLRKEKQDQERRRSKDQAAREKREREIEDAARKEHHRATERERQRKLDADRRRREEDAAAAQKARTLERERRHRGEDLRQQAQRERLREQQELREQQRALEETTEQMARERVAALERDTQMQIDEETRRYYSPRAGMPQRQIGLGFDDHPHSSGMVASGALLPVGRAETTRERGERVIAEARAEAARTEAETRAQRQTRNMMDLFGDISLDESDGARAFGDVLPRRHSRRDSRNSKGHEGGYYSDIEGGRRRRKRYFD